MNNFLNISNKTALVTGGSRGIGRMITEHLVKAGVKTYISSRNSEACDSLVKELAAHGQCIAIPADVSSNDGIEALKTAFSQTESGLDILVNNAGVAWGAPIDEFPERAWDKVMDVNLRGAFFVTKAFLPYLRCNATLESPGRILNIGSVEGSRAPDIDTYSYACSKAGVHHLTRMLAKKLAPEHICVNAVAPGPFDTDMMAWALAEGRKEIEQMVPLKRLGRAQDIASLIHFLASPASSFISGAVIPLDGGISVQ